MLIFNSAHQILILSIRHQIHSSKQLIRPIKRDQPNKLCTNFLSKKLPRTLINVLLKRISSSVCRDHLFLLEKIINIIHIHLRNLHYLSINNRCSNNHSLKHLYSVITMLDHIPVTFSTKVILFRWIKLLEQVVQLKVRCLLIYWGNCLIQMCIHQNP